MSTKHSKHFSKIRENRVKYLKLFPLFIYDIDRTAENDDHWPHYQAKIVDDLIMIPDVEQGDKLFRYGSFGKSEFIRTTTHVSPSTPLEIVPNNKRVYEKPYRLRAMEFDSTNLNQMEFDDNMSSFEKEFLIELNKKMFPSSIDEVRQKNYDQCHEILQQTRILDPTMKTIDSQSISDCNIEISSTKLLIYENVYLLPEEAIFLQHALGCLTVYDESNQILTPDNLWKRFSLKDQCFAIKYIVYYRFRSSGWIVKSGLKFGCDYMIYKFGPVFNHSNYCLSIENFWNKNSFTWSFISGLNRACLNAGKILLLVHVQFEDRNIDNIEDFLRYTQVKILEINRWLPVQQQTQQ